MGVPMVESWDALRGFQVAATIIIAIAVPWFGLIARDRRRALDDRLAAIEEHLKLKLGNAERQLNDLRTEVREARQEGREERKECAENIRAIAAQISEYPRRREVSEAISDVWRAIRSRRGDE